MNKSTVVSVLSAALLAAVASHARAAESVYQIDPVHSVVLLKVKHLNVANAWGRLNDLSGEVRYNEEAPEKSSIAFEAKTASIDTANEKRDKHLRGPDFFNAAEFPSITFKSTKVEKKDDDEFEVTGDFTVRGVTRPVTFEFEVVGRGKGMQGEERIGGETKFKVKRSDFGIDYMPDGLGDEVGVIVSVEGIKQ